MRTQTIFFRATPSERELLRKAAFRAGITLSQLVRSAALKSATYASLCRIDDEPVTPALKVAQ